MRNKKEMTLQIDQLLMVPSLGNQLLNISITIILPPLMENKSFTQKTRYVLSLKKMKEMIRHGLLLTKTTMILDQN
jgi:hypothetical protein